MHPTQMALVARVQLQDLLAVCFRQFRTHYRRHRGAAAVDDLSHRGAGRSHSLRNRAAAVALFVELQNRSARGFVYHGPLSSSIR